MAVRPESCATLLRNTVAGLQEHIPELTRVLHVTEMIADMVIRGFVVERLFSEETRVRMSELEEDRANRAQASGPTGKGKRKATALPPSRMETRGEKKARESRCGQGPDTESQSDVLRNELPCATGIEIVEC